MRSRWLKIAVPQKIVPPMKVESMYHVTVVNIIFKPQTMELLRNIAYCENLANIFCRRQTAKKNNEETQKQPQPQPGGGGMGKNGGP